MTKQINNNFKTFSNLTELGKAIGSSRQTASNKLKAKGWAGRLSFSDDEISELASSIKRTKDVKQKDGNHHGNQDANMTAINALKEQLQAKDKQIESLLQNLDQQQRLQLQLQKQVETLQLNQPTKKSFWQRLFGGQSDNSNQ